MVPARAWDKEKAAPGNGGGWDWLRFAQPVSGSLREPPARTALSSHRKASSRLRRETEGVGFEPTETCASSVFKTDALNRSATPPLRNKGKIIRRPRGCPSRGAAPPRPSASPSSPPKKRTAARNPDGGCEFMIEETYSSFCCTSSPTAFTPSPTCSTALPAALSVSLVAS